MRRLRDRRPSTMFRGSELPRLMTMIIMLGVLALLIGLARDTKTWRWLAPEEAGEHVGAPGADQGVPAPEPVTLGPTDDDPEEQDAAREEFQAITDKSPLAREEMPAYWRLLAWERHQSTDDLLKRASTDVPYNELWQQPGKWRGKLLRIRVHLRQAIRVDDLPDNVLGLKTIYEVSGWNSDSQPYWYWIVTPQLPPGMPLGKNIYEEATFVGYFLKLQPYEDREGKSRAMPLLIGRLVWHPAANPLAASDEWTWPWYLGGALVVLFILRRGLALVGRGSAARSSSNVSPRSDPEQVDAWLNEAESPTDHAGGNGHNPYASAYPPSPPEMTGPPPSSG